MKNSQWTRKDLFAGLRRRLRRGKSSLRKIQRQLKLESLETRKLLTVTVSAQPLIMLAGDVRSVQVTLDGQLTAPATVDYVVSDGSAAEGADFFVPPATTLSFQPGQTIADIIPVFTNADPAAVANKWFTITLGNPTGELSLGTSQTVCTLLESTAVIEPQFVGSGMDSFLSPQSLPAQATDLPTVSIRGPRTMSGSSNTDFLVTLSQPADSAVTVEYATKIGGTDSTSDGPAATGYTTIPAGGTYGWISPPTLDDLVNEASDEYLTVSVTGATGAAVPADTAARAVRPMSPSPPTVSINDAARVNESGTTSFGVTLSHSTTSPVTVYYYTNDGSAKQGVNYTAAGQGASITIPAGSVSGWIPVVTRDDHVYEQNDLDFTAGISSATGASVPTGTSAYGGIHNIDATSANHGGVCACQPVSNDDGGLLIDAPTIPGATSLSSPDANAKDYQIGPPAVLTTSSFGVVVTRQNGDLQVWQSSGGSYTKTNSVTQGTLTQPGGSGTDFIETDLDGTQWIFAGSTGNGYQLGQIKSMTPPGGGGAVTYTYPSGQWRSVTATSSSTSQSATYTLSSGKVTAVSVINDSGSTQTSVSSAALTYYSSGQNGGPTDDLELLLAYDGAGALTNATYYRYYQGNYRAGNESGYNSGDNPGMQDELKFVVSGTDLERLMKANNLSSYSQLDGLTDAQVDAYADDFYKYNTNNLIQEIDAAGGGCSNCGGVGASTFAYAYNSPSTDATVWFSEKVETRADGSTVTTFDNYLGETILQDTWNGLSGSGSQHAITYNYYDSTNGNILDAYQPSAMTGSTPYTFNGTTLSVSPNSSTGVVNVYSYYGSTSATTSTAGGVTGWLYQTGVAQGSTQAGNAIGSTGGPILETATDYIAATVNSITSYFTNSDTQYQDTSGSIPETTSYSYEFFAQSNAPAIQSVTTTLPTASTSQHGSGTAPSSTVVYDQLGRVTWSQDSKGTISYTQYDPASGGVVEQIQDVNTNVGGAYEDWVNTSGMELITNYSVDSYGRPTKETDPNGDVTYTVYNDANQEIRVYPGWHQDGSGYWQPTGPVYDVRTDLTGVYGELLTYSWDNPANLQSFVNSSDHSPNGGESLIHSTDPYVTIQSLSRSVLDQTGQVVQSLAYVNFNSTSYSTSTAAFGTEGTNYLETDYSYDPMGRAESAISPAGAVSFTVYDGFGEVAAHWAGTTTATTPAARASVISGFRTSGDDSASSTATSYSASGVQLYKNSTSVYDIDGDVTATTGYVDGNSSHNRTTTYGYDWRDRQVYAVNPADDQSRVIYTMTTLDNLGEATQTQQYRYEGNNLQNNLNTQHTAATPGKLYNDDVLLAQNTSAYDPLGEVYQSASYIVSGGLAGTAQTSNYWYDLNGNQVALEDPVQNGTMWAYNDLGQETQVIQGLMSDGSTSPWSFAKLPPANGQSRTFEVYVHLPSAPTSGWQSAYSVSDSGGTPSHAWTTGTTALPNGWYDLGSVTLSGGDSSTSVTVSKASDSNPVPDEVFLGFYNASTTYDSTTDQLTVNLDRDGRGTKYTYDTIGRVTGEYFYATSTLQNPTETIAYAYDSAGRLQSASDEIMATSATVTDSYAYDMAGEVTSDTQTVPGLTPSVALSEAWTNANRTQLATAIGGTNDFVNNYQYQGPMGQMSQVTQATNSGNAVAPKAGTFAYDYLGEFTTVNRYNDVNASVLVASAAYAYDKEAHLLSLDYSYSQNPSITLDNFTWSYDALGNVATSQSSLDTAGAVTFSNDSTGQLTGATGGPAPNESYSYDANGNRSTQMGYTTGVNNELLFDGTYTYAYDVNGNRISRTATDGSKVLYTWDNRNRLTSVTFKNSGGTTTQTVTYIYDAFNRWVGETITAGGTTTQTRFVYDGNQIVMQFDGTGTGALAASNLSHRYLWGPAVDQLLSDEKVTNGLSQQGTVVWALGDNLNTVRDLATYSGGTTTVVNHRVFSAYGQLKSETIPGGGNATVTSLFAYAGRPLDRATDLQNNLNRWYDAVTGRWLSQDPIGFGGGDGNLYRYAGNSSANTIDPSGLQAPATIGDITGHNDTPLTFIHPPTPAPAAPTFAATVPGDAPSGSGFAPYMVPHTVLGPLLVPSGQRKPPANAGPNPKPSPRPGPSSFDPSKLTPNNLPPGMGYQPLFIPGSYYVPFGGAILPLFPNGDPNENFAEPYINAELYLARLAMRALPWPGGLPLMPLKVCALSTLPYPNTHFDQWETYFKQYLLFKLGLGKRPTYPPDYR